MKTAKFILVDEIFVSDIYDVIDELEYKKRRAKNANYNV